jgi:hypothetical protein
MSSRRKFLMTSMASLERSMTETSRSKEHGVGRRQECPRSHDSRRWIWSLVTGDAEVSLQDCTPHSWFAKRLNPTLIALVIMFDLLDYVASWLIRLGIRALAPHLTLCDRPSFGSHPTRRIGQLLGIITPDSEAVKSEKGRAMHGKHLAASCPLLIFTSIDCRIHSTQMNQFLLPQP